MKKILLCEQLFREETQLFQQRAEVAGVVLDIADPVTSVQLKTHYDAVLVRTYRSFGLISEFLNKLPGRPKIFGFNPDDTIQLLNKFEDMLLLEKAKVQIPKTWLENPGGTVVEKSFWGYGGQGVALVDSGQSSSNCFYQEYLSEQAVDYRIYDGLNFLVSRAPAEGDFRSNRYQGGACHVLTYEQACGQLSKEIVQDMFFQSQIAISVLNRHFSAVDIKIHGGKAFVLEVNRTPRMRIEPVYAQLVVDTWLSRIVSNV